MHTRSLICLVALAVSTALGCSKESASAQEAKAAQTPAAEATPAPPKPMPAELPEVLARVNGEPVTKFDFERLVRNMEAGNGPIPAERRDEILRAALDQLITYNIMRQEVVSRGLSVSDADVEARIKQMQAQFPSPAEFDKALASRNTTLEQLRVDAKQDMLIDKMMEGEVASVPEATDAEAKEFYDKNPDKFEQAEQVRASHILVRAAEDADEATKKAARAKIDGLLKRVKAGEDFAALASEHSDDGSKAQGGDLGFFGRGQMVPPFEEAAFSLKPGEISGVVTSPFGYHIIKTTERKAASTVPYDQVKGQIVQYLSNQKKQDRVENFIEQARSKAKIEVLV